MSDFTPCTDPVCPYRGIQHQHMPMRPVGLHRFNVYGPIQDGKLTKWAVNDVMDHGQDPAFIPRKPVGYIEMWATEAAAQRHADLMNKRCGPLTPEGS